MLNPDCCWIKAQCFTLHLCSINELSGGDKHTWETSSFQVGDVMHTA
jgi:hypothetical protein